MSGKFGFAIDRGGTFTDIYVQNPDGIIQVFKLLSEDEDNYHDAPTEAIRRVLKVPPNVPIPTDKISWIHMGTTVATNALLERKGEKMVLLVTKGFKDLLYIGNQSRPKIFDLNIKVPEMLYELVIEVDERVVLFRKDCEIPFNGIIEKTATHDMVQIRKQVDTLQLEVDLKNLLEKGYKSIAVVLLHSYMYPKHEQIVGNLARKLGFQNVSLSSEIMPMIKVVPRGFTACVDAYLTPKIHDYVSAFCRNFDENLRRNVKLLFMQSDGGLCPVEFFSGSRSILSGPAGGVIGVSLTAYNEPIFDGLDGKIAKQIIGFDMGGTSTDVSRYAGESDHVMETTTAGVSIQAPQLDIRTVAAGGGSRLFVRRGLFVVGPESTGAFPGPACYSIGGLPAITDANLVLGRIVAHCFPPLKGGRRINRNAAYAALESLTKEANELQHEAEKTVHQVALGFIDVANETMCRPIRELTQARGYDPKEHVLACFGGAGGQHACAIASSLGMKTIFVHRFAGILSAYGLALADVVFEQQQPANKVYSEETIPYLNDQFDELQQKCVNELKNGGFSEQDIKVEHFLHMRYDRTDCALMINAENCTKTGLKPAKLGDFSDQFQKTYKREFDFDIPGRDIIVDDIRVRASGKRGLKEEKIIEKATNPQNPPMEMLTDCYFKEGFLKTPVHLLKLLKYMHEIEGPAIIVDNNSTILVEPDWSATITRHGDIKITQNNTSIKAKETLKNDPDPIQLSIFSHRFMSIAEQMGRTLQRTAISTNIKERLDFSCAVFDKTGGLVANAPHIPVHLGGMHYAVQFQIENLTFARMKEGDVILSNHPIAGGSHLPDLTVITPVYCNDSKTPALFVANRGHHADIGGLVPGSMPPHSTCISQEGATFVSFKLKESGVSESEKERQLEDRFLLPGTVAGCSGTRNLSDNKADLRAQMAANNKGVELLRELIDIYTLDTVLMYMNLIQENAESSVRHMLKQTATRFGRSQLEAEDKMDDGTVIKLTVKIDENTGSAIFDFEGTGPENRRGNCNAPLAVTTSTVIYALRCLVGEDIPLNQGCLRPIQLRIPAKSLLSPDTIAAVVGGNVLTSQRICDVIFKAFNQCADSQGCMNNITFGDTTMGYYETVAGGAGAGGTWHGRSGIHTHMTNTRITDPEILEKRYPVILRRFSLRENSGGDGHFRGGDGILRIYEFRKRLTLSVLTERRVFAPNGINGGENGATGRNLLYTRGMDGHSRNLGPKQSVDVQPGDVFELHTPGGGGYGRKLS